MVRLGREGRGGVTQGDYRLSRKCCRERGIKESAEGEGKGVEGRKWVGRTKIGGEVGEIERLRDRLHWMGNRLQGYHTWPVRTCGVDPGGDAD